VRQYAFLSQSPRYSLGYPDQAAARSRAAIAEAWRLAHPPSLAVSLSLGKRLTSLVGDNAALREWVDQLVTVTTEHGFPFWRAEGTVYCGWVKVTNGDVAEGIPLMRRGLNACRATAPVVAAGLILSPSSPRHTRFLERLKRP
jgi:adenylate cyclase